MEGTLSAISDFVRRNPRTTAMAAFNLGLYAAMVARMGVRHGDLKEFPGKLVGLVPSMYDLLSLFGENGASSRKGKQRRRPAARRKRRAGRTAAHDAR